jgi:peptidoglycan/LPS O-acetylase OafA/YrhL
MQQLSYIPKLDGLRGLSIFLVLVAHFYSSGLDALGYLGVTIFFVISGYLITSILLSYAENLSIGTAAIKFYGRRTLRLFPAYYLCIAVTAILNVMNMRQIWWIDALYLNNFKIAHDGNWGVSGHFWSLCVEEQFYLLWFPLVMLLSRRKLLHFIVACLLAGPLFRWTAFYLGTTDFYNVLLPCQVDSLATGALIAYAMNFSKPPSVWKILKRWRLPLLLGSAYVVMAMMFLSYDTLDRIFLASFTNIVGACLVSISIDSESDWKFGWLENRYLRHIGKISYGIYVYHYFLKYFEARRLDNIAIQNVIENYIPHSYTVAICIRFFILSALAVLIAELSWRLIERPILKLKDLPLFKMAGQPDIAKSDA